MQRFNGFTVKSHTVDFCVVGGGMAGICAAIAAARGGASVVLMQDRPVLGGNASSEIRMHICGAERHVQFPNLRETGILEELRMENLRRNPHKNYSIWDTILYEKVKAEKNITLFLNCTCQEAETKDDKITLIRGWQMTTETTHEVRAKLYADCSGDGTLGAISGADFRRGREARSEYGETIGPEVADDKTMGMTCMFQAREYDSEQVFEPLPWAHRYENCNDLPYGEHGHDWVSMGYWWVELGGEHDSIADTEYLRDELLKVVYGIWDHIKNRCAHRSKAKNLALDWVQFLPGKRESRRFMGPHVLTQRDIEAQGRFDDMVCYGGWSMDDHHWAGFRAKDLDEPATIFHEAPSPYGIPWGCLYSRNIANLLFAGRNASCTHAAMSSTRVMGTACVMGQAVGTAAALAIARGKMPGEMVEHIGELQAALQADDCFLPWRVEAYSTLTTQGRLSASSADDVEAVRDGVNRPFEGNEHRWECEMEDWVMYEWDQAEAVCEVRIAVDSGMYENVKMSNHQRDNQLTCLPGELPRGFVVEGRVDGQWQVLAEVADGHERLYRLAVDGCYDAIRWTLKQTWGAERSGLYTFVVE